MKRRKRPLLPADVQRGIAQTFCTRSVLPRLARRSLVQELANLTLPLPNQMGRRHDQGGVAEIAVARGQREISGRAVRSTTAAATVVTGVTVITESARATLSLRIRIQLIAVPCDDRQR
jgi:hypothetical protein